MDKGIKKIVVVPKNFNIKDYNFIEVDDITQLAWRELHWIIVDNTTTINIIQEVYSRFRNYKKYK